MEKRMGDRMKELRRHFGITQEAFAARLKVTRGAIANYEVGRNLPTDAVLELMSREFGVSIQWLRTGQGPMLMTRKPELEAFFNDLLSETEDSFRRRLVSILAELSPKQWEVLEGVARKLTAGAQQPEEKAQPSPEEEAQRAAEAAAQAAYDQIYQQTLAAKKAEAESSASSSGEGNTA